MCGDRVAGEFHSGEKIAVGDAGGREQHVALRHFFHPVDLVGIGNAHLGSTGDLLGRIELQPALHLAADAAQCGCGQNALGRATDTQIEVDACFVRIGRMNYAGNVAIADQANGSARPADFLDQLGMARAVEDADGNLVRLYTLGLGHGIDVLGRRRIELDRIGRIAGTDGHLFHVNVRGVEQTALLRDRDHGQRIRQVLGADRGAFERIERDIDCGAILGADFLADIEHRRLVALALADHHRAVDRQTVELLTHGIHSHLIGGLLVATPPQPGCCHCGALRHTGDFQCENAIETAGLGILVCHETLLKKQRALHRQRGRLGRLIAASPVCAMTNRRKKPFDFRLLRGFPD